MKALIFAAGLGTRLRPLTDTLPKALVQLAGHTLLEYQIAKLKSAGLTDILINVHHFPDKILAYLYENNNFGCSIHISDEREALLDTGGGLLKAWSAFAPNATEPILAMNVDILSTISLADILSAYDPNDLALLVVKERETQRYLCFDDSNILRAWTNKVTGEVKPHLGINVENLVKRAFSGLQVLSPTVQPLLQTYALEHGSKFSIIDFYLHVVENNLGTLRGMPFNVPMLDVGKIEHIHEAEEFAKMYIH